jgi:hypothetical protein
VRNVYSHTTILVTQNTSDAADPNQTKFRVFDNIDGAPILSLSVKMQPEGVIIYDTWFDDRQFGDLPINAAGGSIVSMRISADEPVALMSYGDEMNGEGSSAYMARPASDASTKQFLPAVRANYLGDSLIAITNADMSNDANVKVTFRGHDPGIAGNGETFTTEFTVGARGAAFLDLADLGRGNQPSPVPRGGSTNRGFFGSAIIESSRPILVAVHEEARVRRTVRSVAAYNAFGEADLSTRWAVSRLKNYSSGRRSYVVLQNPGLTDADVGLTYRGLGGAALQSSRVSVPSQGVTIVTPDRGLHEECQLAVASDQLLAVLVYDTTLHGPSDWGRWGLDQTIYQATALLTDYETPTPAPVTDTPPPPTETLTPTATLVSTSTPSATATDRPGLPFKALLPMTCRNCP